MVNRSDTIGKPLLEAFPDTSEEYTKTGRSQLTESIQRAIKTGKPDAMPDLKYDLKDKSGKWEERYWSVTHYPIFEDGKVIGAYQETKDITKERAISRQLDKTYKQLEQILSTSMVGTWQWHIRQDYVTADENLARMFGIDSREAKKGLPLERFLSTIHEDDRAQVQASIEDAIDNESLYEEEYRIVQSDGGVRWVIARGTVEVDDDEEPVSFSGTIIDVTDRKEAELDVMETESRLRFMADSMPQLVWITRADGYHEYYNQRWYDYTGTAPGTTDGDGWNDLFHLDDQARARDIWQKSLKTGEPYEIEYRLYHAPSDRYRWVIGRAMPFRNEEGEIQKWYGTCTDIDDQRRNAEVQSFLADVSKKLSSSLDYKKMLVSISELCVPVIADWCTVDLYDPERGFEQVSVAHQNPDKVNEAREFRKRNPLDINAPTGIPNILRTGRSEFYPLINDQLLEASIDDPETLAFMKSFNLHSIAIAPLRINDEVVGGITFVTSDSNRYMTQADLDVINDLAHRISLAITNSKLYTDARHSLKQQKKLEQALLHEKEKLEQRVTERTKQLQLTNEGLRDEILKRQTAEKQLQAHSKELTRSNEELENFAYVASHDLQEPLRKIQAFGDLLLTEYGDSLGLEGSDYLTRMHAAANRMSNLIGDLLNFSRVARNVQPKRDVDLNTVISEVLGDLETRIQETGATIDVGTLPMISATPTHMRQLFQNLIGNAVKFHKPDEPPVVRVRSQEKDGGVEITVSDNGVGFDEKYLDRIFSVFQRLHERSKYEGTGIGLAVCRKIVEYYGGTITASSKKNHGSTFIVWLPAKGKEK